MALILIMCVSVGEAEVYVCVHKSWGKVQQATHRRTHTADTSIDTSHTGALIHCRDYRWSMTWLTLGSTGLCLSVPILLGPPFVCPHSTRHCEAVCVCVCIFPCLPRGLSGEEKRKKRGKKGGNQRERGGREERRERRRQENMLSLSLSPSLPPSLTRPHTVVSTMITERWSQSLASQKTASRQRATRKRHAERRRELRVTNLLQLCMLIERSSL